MSKKISQETFDEVVRENVEEFGLTDVEALQDTINQFVKQGVNLSNIDITGGIGRDEMLSLISNLRSISSDTSDRPQALTLLDEASSLCSKECQFYLRNQMLFKEKGGLNSLHILFDAKQPDDILLKVMSLLNDLSKSNGKY